MSPGMFLSRYWQKRPLFIPAALDTLHPALDADELAWLAMQEDVESRIAFSHGDEQHTRYELKHGPFEEAFLAGLPRHGWTLLVQDVEKHLPDFRAIFGAVDFVADWRIDDLMVSYATPGGGVGPHLDHYDVFLCQGQGRREWRLGSADACTPYDSGGDLSLLQPFDDEHPIMAASGDVLYLPPGVPHWGIARDNCMTWSVGMRAPTLEELLATAQRVLDVDSRFAPQESESGRDVFYEDADLTPEEAEPGKISDEAIRRSQKILQHACSLDDRAVAIVLGCTVTEAKAWLVPEMPDAQDANEWLAARGEDTRLVVHGMARIAWHANGESLLLFANGSEREVSGASLDLLRELCRHRWTTRAQFLAQADEKLLRWLLERGVFDLTERHD